MHLASHRLLQHLALLLLTIAVATCTDSTGPSEPEPSGEDQVWYDISPTGALVDPPAVFVGTGDIADCGGTGDSQTAALLDNISGDVFSLGDNVYPNGTTSEFNNCYDPTWGRHIDRTHPSAGNHDYNTSGATPYFNYFGAAAGAPGEGYYSFELGAWHIIVLNSNISRTPSSPQVQWLRTDLAAHPNLCTLAYWHHPLYSSTSGGGSGGLTYSSVRTFWDTLYAAGVDLVLNGHRHFYERLAPMKPAGTADNAFGIREIIVGSGGIGTLGTTNVFPTSEVRNGNTFGVLKLYLYPDSYAWRFIPVAGKTFTDSASTACHSSPGSGSPGISPSLSTVSADPTTITAGSGSSTITVTARDSDGDPVSGATVVLSASGTGNTLIQPSGPTDASGEATGTLSSTGAGTKTVSAVISGTPITQTAAVTVTAGPASASQSTVSANPSTIAANTGTSTITVTVRDQFGNPVSGSTVALTATGTGNTLTQPAGPTNGSGVATGTLASTDLEVKTVSATAGVTAITQTAAVTVVPESGGATITHSLLTAANDPANKNIYTTASIAPAPNTLVTIALLSHRVTGVISPTVSGGGMASWTLVTSVDFDPLSLPGRRLSIYRALSPSPGSGPITFNFSNALRNLEWIVSQWDGVETSGVNGAGAIVQSGSNRADAVSGLSAALAPFGNPNNVAYGAFGVNSEVLTITPGTGFLEIAEQPANEFKGGDLQAERAVDRSTIDATWTTTLRGGALGIEIKAATGP
jgi:hypothetical protein